MKDGTGNWNIYYICRDYLGSITQITKSYGVVQELSYDAWGQLRNPANQTVYAPDTAPELFLGRGYTGHEHLPQFGLINMNARLYDPALGRFLSPDPFVKNPFSSQGFNRFSYAMNNPMSYIDRDGQFPWLVFLIVAAFMYLDNAHNNTPHNKDAGNPGNWAWNPTSWNSTIVGNVGYNTGGNWTFSGGIGNPNGLIPVMGYNTQYGPGVGVNNYGSTSMYYPGYENRVNNAIEQGANNAFNNARTSSWTTTGLSTGTAVSSEVLYSKYFGTWFGKNGKFYDQSWGGNGYTGGKNMFANKLSTKISVIGKIAGGYNAYNIYEQYNSGEMDVPQLIFEEASNAYSTLGGAYGIAWGVGWESGRLISQQSWYQRAKFNFWRQMWEYKYGPPSDQNYMMWRYFYEDYKP